MFNNVFSGKKVLITGNTGFKGTWLSLWLHSLGAEIVGISKDIPTNPSLFESIEMENKITNHFIDICSYDELKEKYGDKIDNFKIERFICAHAIMLSFEGIPAIYIHSLLGTKNDYEKLNDPSKYRAINRYQWQKKELYKQLNDPGSENHNILNRFNHLLSIRS